MTDAAREVYLLEGVRTGRGRGSSKGSLAGVAPLALVTTLLDALAARGVRPDRVDDLLLGCATQTGEQGADLARTAALLAGWPTPGLTVNRFCASGMEALALAAAKVRAGDAELCVAGGVESVSRVPMFSDGGALWADPAVRQRVGSVHMGVAADVVATLEGFERAALDDYALRSRARAQAAWAAGVHADVVVPVAVREGVSFARDEMVDATFTADELAAMPPAFEELGAAGQDAVACARTGLAAVRHVHTRGSSPALADAAALGVLGTREAARALGLRPRARVVATASCAGDPVVMLTAGQAALERCLARAGVAADELAAVVFAEAFSALCLRLARDLRLGPDRMNPWGGTMAQGHAFGATGAVLALEAASLLERTGGGYAAAAVSGAAGLGAAVLLARA